MFKNLWSKIKENWKGWLLVLLTGLFGADKAGEYFAPEPHPVSFEESAEVADRAPADDERTLGLYEVQALWVKDVVIKRQGLPELQYKDFAVTTNHRLRLTAFPTTKEIADKIGTLFDYNLQAFFITKEIIKPAPAEIDIKQPDKKEKAEPTVPVK